MHDHNSQIATNLEQRINALVRRYRSLQSKEQKLLAENQRLTDKLEELAKEQAELSEKYNTLKVSKAFEIASGGETHLAKITINQVVREIDKCIALLNK